MNNNNLHRIFNDTVCVSTEWMISYLDGNLSERENNSVEVHLASCEMCRDELDGLKALNDKTKLPAIISSIDTKIEERIALGGKKIRLFRPITRIAAAILILVGSAWFINYYLDSSTGFYSDDMVSQSVEEKSPLVDEIEATDSELESADKFTENTELIKTDKSEAIVSGNRQELERKIFKDKRTEGLVTDEVKDSEEEIVIKPVDPESLSATIDDDVIVLEDYKTVNEKKKEEKIRADISENKKQFAKEDAQIDADYNAGFSVADEQDQVQRIRGNNRTKSSKKLAYSKQKGIASTENTVKINSFNQAVTEFNQQQYRDAIKHFKLSVKEHAFKDEVNFYLAVSYENINSPKKALNYYNKVISDQSSPLYETALWNKSQILLNMQKEKSAVNSLNQVKNLKGNYSRRADIMLDSIKVKRASRYK